MSDPIPSSSTPDAREEDRLAACFSCKRSKLKCVRAPGSTTCTRCVQRQLDCAAPQFHVGRHKGVKNKHSGLEKAVYQIEQALRRTQSGSDQIQNADQSNELRYLLDRSKDLLGAEPRLHRRFSSISESLKDQAEASTPQSSITLGTSPSQAGSREDAVNPQKMNEDIDDAENPLQLLARTSELLSSIGPQVQGHDNVRIPLNSTSARILLAGGSRSGDLRDFFGRFKPRLDVGEDLDPVELGLVTFPEAEALFSYFFERLAHTRWGIDPTIHTATFVRSRSAFLFTSICAASALFQASMESLHKRLSNHRQKLANLVMAKRYKSVEIVLAFMLNTPWISAGDHWADDETSTYISMALGIALDLSLNKIILPSAPSSPFSKDSVATFDRISTRRALAVDGFPDVDPGSLMGRRLLRRRERTWLALFVLERGICLARGRAYLLPISPLIEQCDGWYLCDLAEKWDGSIVSVAVLRRDLAKLIANIRLICDSYVSGVSESVVVDRLKNEITVFFDRWYQTWPVQIGGREQLTLPPYVEILASHTRLSMYSSVINHSTAPTGARHFFRAAGLSSALNVLRVAVQGEGQLRSMPNNTAIMISFAACFALRVSTVMDDRGSSLAPSIRALIAETTDALERIGSTPVQRKGLSCLFARQLRQILKLSCRPPEVTRSFSELAHSRSLPQTSAPLFTDMKTMTHMAPTQLSHPGTIPQMHHHQMPTTTVPSDYLLFSTMSNDQLNEVINNTDVGVGVDAMWEDFQFQHASELDWMDWSTFA